MKRQIKTHQNMMIETCLANENNNLTLRKLRLFESLMKKRYIEEQVSAKPNIEINSIFANLKRSNVCSLINHSNNTSNKSILLIDLLNELNQLFTQNRETELLDKLNLIKLLISVGRNFEVVYNKQVTNFVLNALFQTNSNIVFESCLSLIVLYSFNSCYMTNTFNSVETINQLIDKTELFKGINTVNSILTIIGNIIVDCSISILGQSNFFLFFDSIMANNNYVLDANLIEIIFWALYLMLSIDYVSTINRLPSLISFVVEYIRSLTIINRTTGSEKNMNLFISVCYYLSKDNDICNQLIVLKCFNYLLQLFNYLRMNTDEMTKANIAVLHSESVYGLLLIFNNMISATLYDIDNQLEEELYVILVELIKQYRIIPQSKRLGETTEKYSFIQKELMLLIEHISDLNMKLFHKIIMANSILRIISKFYSKNTQCLSSIINIVNNIVTIDNTVLTYLIEIQLFSKVLNHILKDPYISINVKTDYIVFLNNVFNFTSFRKQNKVLSDLINEMNQGKIIDSLAQICNQYENESIGNLCETSLKSYKILAMLKHD